MAGIPKCSSDGSYGSAGMAPGGCQRRDYPTRLENPGPLSALILGCSHRGGCESSVLPLFAHGGVESRAGPGWRACNPSFSSNPNLYLKSSPNSCGLSTTTSGGTSDNACGANP